MKLHEYRARKGLTQQDVADAIQLSKNRISEIESGHGCSLATALKIEVYTKGAVKPVDLAGSRKERV